MKDYLKKDDWKVIEEGFHPEYNEISESIFSTGNGYMGTRGNFEENYSGSSLQGSYVSGIYYPDKTRVGWWKNGYPEYFAKVLNNVNWIGIRISINGKIIDLNEVKILHFTRELNLKNAMYSKTITFEIEEGVFTIQSERFCSYATQELGCIKYSISTSNYTGQVTVIPYLDFNVRNQDSNYDEQFWDIYDNSASNDKYVEATTKKTNFTVRAKMAVSILDREAKSVNAYAQGYYERSFELDIAPENPIALTKLVIITTSFHHDNLANSSIDLVSEVKSLDYDQHKTAHETIWSEKWEMSDVVISGDVAAQQGIRFNILQMHQTYSGEDPRLNIGPKGFTGEKYGGSTYWDTEAYCLPFYMSTAPQKVAKNLLVYRYKHLQKAIENAEKLGFTSGAALYPMVTMNGEECHNEWEITFEEIHRNGAIAYAIYDYIRYTGDKEYLKEYGLEVLIGIARFWAQRCNYSENIKQYVILGVTGPNEYENNVNNNWYTNYIAKWCMQYTLKCIEMMKTDSAVHLANILDKLEFSEEEADRWIEIVAGMHLPYDSERNVFLQQDGFLDKELIPVDQLKEEDKPLNQNWSWDRILRSCYIKQADVLQGMYFFEEHFTAEQLRSNFDFYEPMTVHESSLSPCVHSILASKLSKLDKAYEMYLRTSRLDLDDYNNDTQDGLHITSMAGSWMSIVKGFGGMRVLNDVLHLSPIIPKEWEGYSFKLLFREHLLMIKVDKTQITVENTSDVSVSLQIFDQKISVPSQDSLSVGLAYST